MFFRRRSDRGLSLIGERRRWFGITSPIIEGTVSNVNIGIAIDCHDTHWIPLRRSASSPAIARQHGSNNRTVRCSPANSVVTSYETVNSNASFERWTNRGDGTIENTMVGVVDFMVFVRPQLSPVFAGFLHGCSRVAAGCPVISCRLDGRDGAFGIRRQPRSNAVAAASVFNSSTCQRNFVRPRRLRNSNRLGCGFQSVSESCPDSICQSSPAPCRAAG